MSEVFRSKTEALARGLENEGDEEAARGALRGLIEKIVIPPGDGLLTVSGNLGNVRSAQCREHPEFDLGAIVGCGGSQPPISAALAVDRMRRRRVAFVRCLATGTGSVPDGNR